MQKINTLVKAKSIGIFDSGIGGLTVMQQIKKKLPGESLVYFGDTARVPYGGKSPETIIRYSIENAIFLMEQNIKILINACNTSTAYSLEKLQLIFNIPIVGVIEPGAEAAVQRTKNGRIAVLGTKATIASGVYQKAIQQILPSAFVASIACPLFVPLVEEQFASHHAAKLIVKEYLEPLRELDVDTVLLGCTHYPLLRELIQEQVGAYINIVDSASTCAEKVAELLNAHDLNAPLMESPLQKYFVSDDPNRFKQLAEKLLNESLIHVEGISRFV